MRDLLLFIQETSLQAAAAAKDPSCTTAGGDTLTADCRCRQTNEQHQQPGLRTTDPSLPQFPTSATDQIPSDSLSGCAEQTHHATSQKVGHS